MRPRSIEMLETLRKSTKKYSADELMAFVDDLRGAAPEQIRVLVTPPERPAKTRKAATPKRAADPFIKKLDAVRKKAGMKAKDAVSALNDVRQQTGVATAVPKTFAGMLGVLRDTMSDAAIEDAFRAAAQKFEQEFSTHYDMS